MLYTKQGNTYKCTGYRASNELAIRQKHLFNPPHSDMLHALASELVTGACTLISAREQTRLY